MAQWINVFRNNSFVNPMRLPLLCEKTGALASHSGTRSYGWEAVRQKNLYKVRKFRFYIFDF